MGSEVVGELLVEGASLPSDVGLEVGPEVGPTVGSDVVGELLVEGASLPTKVGDEVGPEVGSDVVEQSALQFASVSPKAVSQSPSPQQE